jgi:hypothetical protein
MSVAQSGLDAQGDLFEVEATRTLEAESVAFIVCERNGVESRSKTYLPNFVEQNTPVGNLDIYQVMHVAGQIEMLLGIGAKTNFKIAG